MVVIWMGVLADGGGWLEIRGVNAPSLTPRNTTIRN